MIKLISDLPEGVVAAVASGEVSGKDYETVLVPAMENAINTHGSVRFLYHLGPEFKRYSPSAMWDDLKLGFAHFTAWKKLALVTDHEWMAGAARMFAIALPCPVKVFPNARYEEAMRWISEK